MTRDDILPPAPCPHGVDGRCPTCGREAMPVAPLVAHGAATASDVAATVILPAGVLEAASRLAARYQVARDIIIAEAIADYADLRGIDADDPTGGDP